VLFLTRLRACVSLLGLLVCVLLIIPTQAIMIPFGGKKAEIAPRWFFATLSWLFDVRITMKGVPYKGAPVLYISNHISWLDIFVFGAVLRGSFVARGDLEGWPIFGYLSTLQQTVFVDRDNRVRSGRQLDQLTERLLEDDRLILFPEGTSTDGTKVLPFKSSLFAVAERWPGDDPLLIQPMSIRYKTINGMPLTRHYRPFIGWYGDMDLAPHFWDFLQLGRIGVEIEFHEPVSSAEFKSRKAMCRHCHEVIAVGVEQKLAGASHAAAA
jgi:1-acyl-sn-glycerol-3-phosphate acyltransferase